MPRLVFIDGKSSKFWEVEIRGASIDVRWGRIGTAGQSKRHDFSSAAAATAEAAKLVAEKRKKGYRDDDAPADGGSTPKGAAASKADPLYELARLLAANDAEGLVTELRLAVEDGAAYFARFEERLGERGIDAPDDATGTTLPWIALTDGLAARGSLVEVDWKEAVEDIVWNLQKLATKPPLAKTWWAWAEESDVGELATSRFLKLAAKRFAGVELELAQLDIGSDCYPLVLFPRGARADVRALSTKCKKAGFGALAFF